MSSRAQRAKSTKDLFTASAGVLRPAGAALDTNGNTVGTKHDLGRDGAFGGLKIVVLDYYNREELDFSPSGCVGGVIRSKGFELQVMPRHFTTEELEEALGNANQLWVVSGCKDEMEDDMVDVIVAQWKSGLALYLLGDVGSMDKHGAYTAYTGEANKVLKAMGLPTMSDHYLAGMFLNPVPLGAILGTPGYMTHPVTTGISSSLYEGYTIAEFLSPAVILSGCVPIMYNSRGGLSVYVKEATATHGQVIADGAFTKLFERWDAAGSAQFVRNSICFLAADMSGSGTESSTITGAGAGAGAGTGAGAASAQVNAGTLPEYDFTGCLFGECSISCDFGPLCVLAGSVHPLMSNLDDVTMNDPLSVGRRNSNVVGRHVYTVDVASRMLDMGTDPFRRTPVEAILPLVDLSLPGNWARFRATLCDVFTGGRYLPRVATMVFLAVCDYHCTNTPEDSRVWRFFMDKLLVQITSTRTFEAYGAHAPLLDAMEAYAKEGTTHVAPSTVPIPRGGVAIELSTMRLSLTTIGLMARTLLEKGRVPKQRLVEWVRHAFIRALVLCVKDACQTSEVAEFRAAVDRLLFNEPSLWTLWKGVPVAEAPCLDALIRTLPCPAAAGEMHDVLQALQPVGLTPFDEKDAWMPFYAVAETPSSVLSAAGLEETVCVLVRGKPKAETPSMSTVNLLLGSSWTGHHVNRGELFSDMFHRSQLVTVVAELQGGHPEAVSHLATLVRKFVCVGTAQQAVELGWPTYVGKEEMGTDTIRAVGPPTPEFLASVDQQLARLRPALEMLVPGLNWSVVSGSLFATLMYMQCNEGAPYTGQPLVLSSVLDMVSSEDLGHMLLRRLVADTRGSPPGLHIGALSGPGAGSSVGTGTDIVADAAALDAAFNAGAKRLLPWMESEQVRLPCPMPTAEWFATVHTLTPAQAALYSHLVRFAFWGACRLLDATHGQWLRSVSKFLPEDPPNATVAWNGSKYVPSTTCYTGPKVLQVELPGEGSETTGAVAGAGVAWLFKGGDWVSIKLETGSNVDVDVELEAAKEAEAKAKTKAGAAQGKDSQDALVAFETGVRGWFRTNSLVDLLEAAQHLDVGVGITWTPVTLVAIMSAATDKTLSSVAAQLSLHTTLPCV